MGNNNLGKQKIKIAMYNIISGQGDRLKSALCAMEQLNVDIALLTEAKITSEAYTRFDHGLHVLCTEAVHPNQGGVALCWRDSNYCQVEVISRHGPNVISFELVSGGPRWLVIGAYIPPNEEDGTVDFILAARRRRPRLPLILLGDLNIDFDRERDFTEREVGIVAMVTTLGVEDMSRHFWRRRRWHSGYTWQQRRGGMVV
jgi:exonuclease III